MGSEMCIRDRCQEDDAVVQVFFIRGGRLIGRDHFYLRISKGETKAEILDSFIKQYYAGTPFIPGELMLQEELEEQALLEEWLSTKRGQKVTIRIPKKGTKEKLVELAGENAQLVLNKDCLLYTSPSPRDGLLSRMPSSA